MPKENFKDRLAKLQRWWVTAESALNSWQVQAKEDLNFYLGGEKQWDSADLQKLKSQQRPILTFNHLLAIVNLVAGYQRQNQQDIHIYNRKGGSKAVADILTEIIKHIHDNCYGEWENAMAFLIGLITGRGYIGVNLDYDDDIVNGDIVLQNISPFSVYPDPFFERYDMSDGMFLFQTAWLPKSRIDLAYPDKKKELEGLTVSDEKDRQTIPYTEGEKYHDADAVSTATTEIEKYRYRVKQCWWKEMEKQKFIIGLESGMVKQIDWPEEKVKSFLKMRDTFRVINRVRPIMNLTTYVGLTELEHVEDPLNGVTRFPIIPFWAYWIPLIEHYNFGVITQLKDAQREINKRASQALHHLNQSANSGWIADDNALTDWSILEDFGSKPGIIVKKRPNSHVERIQPAAISEGHLTLAQAGKQTIKDVSGINPDLMGVEPGKHESGYLMELRRNQGLVALETIFDNFRLSKQILGTTLVDMIQKTDAYSRQELITLVIDGSPKEIEINQRIMTEGIEQIKNDLTIGKYKCVVSQSPASPTIRSRNFYTLVEAAKAGFPIPPEILVDASDLPDKEKIKESIARQQEQERLLAGGGAR